MNNEASRFQVVAPAFPDPSVLKLPNESYCDHVGTKWAWFAHETDTGMEPFYSQDALRAFAADAMEAAAQLCEQVGRDDASATTVANECAKAIRAKVAIARKRISPSYVDTASTERAAAAHGTGEAPLASSGASGETQ